MLDFQLGKQKILGDIYVDFKQVYTRRIYTTKQSL